MAESWHTLSREDRAEALELAAAQTGRAPHLLEKDVWVVWVLSAIDQSPLANKLTFKGGTSLSKAYKIIDRFSEDIDLTCDIREIAPDLLRHGNPIPETASHAKKISDHVRARLPMWIEREVMPMLREALERDGLQSSLTLAGLERNKLLFNYSPIKRGMGYTAASVQLEFGGRATGEPHQRHAVVCDMAQAIPEIGFPTAQPLVLAAERTFWEKATAAHVFCRQGRLRGDRYSRHWHDLAAMAASGHAHAAMADQALAQAVAEHKSMFFAEKDAAHQPIDYHAAVGGRIQIVPEGGALAALDKDYAAMLEDGLLSTHQPRFADILAACSDLQSLINR